MEDGVVAVPVLMLAEVEISPWFLPPLLPCVDWTLTVDSLATDTTSPPIHFLDRSPFCFEDFVLVLDTVIALSGPWSETISAVTIVSLLVVVSIEEETFEDSFTEDDFGSDGRWDERVALVS